MKTRREGRGKVAAWDLDGSYVSANWRAGSGREEATVKQGKGEMRESPLVVKRADRNPDTFVGLARTYARLDKQDRYDRYSPVPERDTRWPASDWWISSRRHFRSRARAIVQPTSPRDQRGREKLPEALTESMALSSHRQQRI